MVDVFVASGTSSSISPQIPSTKAGQLHSFVARVAVDGQLLRVVHSGQNAADDVEAGGPGKIGDHGVELKVHLGQCLLHALDAGGSLFDQGRALAQIGAQRDDRGGGTGGRAPEAHAVEFLQPLA